MFNKVIWATDGSEHADRALELAKSLVSENGGSLVAVNTIEYLVAKGGGPVFPDQDEREAKIKQQIEDLSATGVRAEVRIVESGANSPAHTVARVAEEEGADLIVAGTRGHTPLAGLLLGSVTQRLLSIAPCPVLVVPN